MTRVETKLDSQINVNNEMNTKLSSVIEMKADVKATASLKAQLDAQAGLLNEIRNTTTVMNSRAGRDVNMLPQTAVDLLTTNLYACVVLILLVLAVVTIAICLLFSASRNREKAIADAEREERKYLFGLLSEALMHLPPEKAAEMRSMMAKKA